MIPQNFFSFTFTFTLSVLIICTCSSSIYDVLEFNGLPIGLLPKGITNFTIDPSTGRFEVYLPQSCDAKFESSVRYDLNVSGKVEFGKLGELSGIAAQELFLWFPVKGIRVDVPSSGLIYFDVGVVSKQFTISLFETPRDCAVTGSQSGDLVFFDVRGRDTESRKIQNKLGRGGAQMAVS